MKRQTALAKLAELQPDQRNANLGTERGAGMLESSLREYGAGRSILLDRKGRVIAGNKTLEAAVDLGFEDVILVQTDGTDLVAVQRIDLDLDEDTRARELAYADNRVAEVDLDWDTAMLAEDVRGGVDVSRFWSDVELASMLPDGSQSEQTDAEVEAAIAGGDLAPYTVTVTCAQAEQLADLVAWLESRGYSYTTSD